MGAIVASLFSMWRYDTTPAVIRPSPLQMPTEIGPPSARIAILLMFLHPHCPCSRASVGELALLMTRCRGRLRAEVYFCRPAGVSSDWEKTDLWNRAAAIPGVHVISDIAGMKARRMNVRTSGETVLYSADGHLLFHGGITLARGHSGDNAGRAAIVSLIETGRASRTTHPVFGCSLLGPPSQEKSGDNRNWTL
jgi:hypothetical protein